MPQMKTSCRGYSNPEDKTPVKRRKKGERRGREGDTHLVSGFCTLPEFLFKKGQPSGLLMSL